MSSSPVVVIGGSAGAIPALQTLLGGLPASFAAPILIVQHLAADAPSLLPHILERACHLPAHQPVDGEPLRPGVVYVAPPDHHLLVDGDRASVTRGPKENRFRPSVDALFRSAAYTRGRDVVGVVLSGLLDDGTSGLWTVKRRGGVAVVQHPDDAQFPDMPLSALREVEVDHVVPIQAMAELLTRLVGEFAGREGESRMSEREEERLRIEVGIAREENPLKLGVTRLGAASLMTCPECQGVLVSLEEGATVRFRCHTGHAYTAAALLSEQTKAEEDKAYQLQRAMEEKLLLMLQLADLCEGRGDRTGARAFHEKAQETEARLGRVRALALRSAGPDVVRNAMASSDD